MASENTLSRFSGDGITPSRHKNAEGLTATMGGKLTASHYKRRKLLRAIVLGIRYAFPNRESSSSRWVTCRQRGRGLHLLETRNLKLETSSHAPAALNVREISSCASLCRRRRCSTPAKLSA